MDAADSGDLVEVSANGGKAEGKAAAGRRAKEEMWSVRIERRMEKIVHLTTKTDDEDLQVGVGVYGGEEGVETDRGGEAVGAEREEDGENLQVGLDGDDGVKIGERM
ncbi:hypothetical protein Syun_001542 [Stephania yunnanensis]|uniref:Uncharacterized protein n=1 Tax=Stephania yunnanensis TaxID=152371 RepID=A0AAP0Q6D6_9MAGN